MVDERLISRCGIYCGACFIYRAERDGGTLLDKIAKKFDVPKEKIRCNGCSGPFEDQWGNCQKCGFKVCQKLMDIENCALCKEYATCPDFSFLVRFTTYRGEDIREGLKRIGIGESEEWLRKQAQHWSCPLCDYPLTWYDNTCRKCDWKVKKKSITMDGFSDK